MANTSVPLNHFDRGKPFYPLIMNYLILLAGIKELSLQGSLEKAAKQLSGTDLLKIKYVHGLEYELNSKITDAMGAVSNDDDLINLLERYESQIINSAGVRDQGDSLATKIRDLQANIRKLAGPLQLRSYFQDEFIEVPISLITNDIIDNVFYLASFTMRSAGSLLILAFETTHQYHDTGPLWEFLRHCRNAAAHNGQFQFNPGEPRHLAKWGKFQLTSSMHGSLLFRKDIETPGLLEPGDPIRLLWDIEQAYPNMQP